MAGMMYETYVLQALRTGIASIQGDVDQLDDILDALSPTELASAKLYFANPKTTIYVAPGFPQESSRMPFVGVTVASEDPLQAQTPISYEFITANNGDGTWTQITGGRYHGTIKATIYTPNPDLILWLTAIVWWSLMTQISLFISTANMNNVLIGMGDYEPSPSFLAPLFVFARGIWVSGEYSKTVAVVVDQAVPGTMTFTLGGT